MLSRLLEGLESIDLSSLEETRMRAAQLLSKVGSPGGFRGRAQRVGYFRVFNSLS